MSHLPIAALLTIALASLAPLAIGSVHRPVIAALALLTALATFYTLRHRPNQDTSSRGLRLGGFGLLLLGLTGYTALQLLPLPSSLLKLLAPASAEVLRLAESSSAWHPISLDPPATLWELLKLATATLLFVLARNTLRSPTLRQTLCVTLALSALLATLSGMLGALVAPGKVMLAYVPQAKPPASLITTSFVNPNHSAAFLVVGVMLALGVAVAQRSAKRSAWALFSATVMMAGVCMTQSLGGLVALGGGLLAFAALLWRHGLPPWLRTGGAIRLTLGLGVILGGLLALPALIAEFEALTPNTTLQLSKVELWPAAWEMLRANWVVGVGRGAFMTTFPRYLNAEVPLDRTYSHLENQYLHLPIEMGVLLGALMIIGSAWALFCWARQSKRSSTDTSEGNPHQAREPRLCLESPDRAGCFMRRGWQGARAQEYSEYFKPRATPPDASQGVPGDRRTFVTEPSLYGAAAAIVALGLHAIVDFNLETLGLALPASALMGALAAKYDAYKLSSQAPQARPQALATRGALATSAALALLLALTCLSGLSSPTADADMQAIRQHIAAGSLERAKGRISTAMRRHPSDHMLPAARAHIAALEQRPTESLKWVNRAMLLFPWSPDLHIRAAETLLSLGRRKQALIEFRLAVASGTTMFRSLPRALRACDKPSEVLGILPEDSEHYLVAIDNLLHQKRISWAVEVGREAFERWPNNAKVNKALGLSIYLSDDRSATARAEAQGIFERFPSPRMALLHSEFIDDPAARARFLRKSIERFPNEPTIPFALIALYHQKLGQVDEAIELATKLTRTTTDRATLQKIHRMLAALYRSADRPHRASYEEQRALEYSQNQ